MSFTWEVYDENGLLQQGAVSSVNTTSPISNTGTPSAVVIALTGVVGLDHGGSGADLSATGGTGQFVRQDSAGAVFTVSAISSADLPTINVAHGGTGQTSLTDHAALIGNGTSAVATLAPSTSRNVMISDGTDWTSRAIADADLPTTLSGHTITGGTINNTPIGGTTQAAGYFSALREYIGGFAAIFTHANSADRTYTLPDRTDTIVLLGATQTLAAKTLTTPTIGDFTNATHTHQDNAGGGTLDAAAIASGTLNNSRVNWASPSAIGTGTPAAGTFTGLTANALTINGTGGAGFVHLPDQASKPSTPSTAVRLYSNGSHRFSWVDVNGHAASLDTGGLTTDRDFILPDVDSDTFVMANFGQTLQSKTLVTPTIASFANATHNHTNAAGGGQLTDAALSAAVTVAKGGTNLTTLTAHAALIGNGTGNVLFLAPGTANNVQISDGTDWTSRALANGDLPIVNAAHGGTGLATLTAHNLLVGNGTGNVLFVAPGTSGNVLTSDGTDWASSAPPSVPALSGGRLTGTSGVPYTTSNVTAITTLYYTAGYNVLYNGSSWVGIASAETSIAVPSSVHRAHAVFMNYNSGTPALIIEDYSQTTISITGATNATPVVLTASNTLSVGDIIYVEGMAGLTSLNGKAWRISARSSTTITCESSVGNGAYTSGGTVYVMTGSSAPALSPALTTQNGITVSGNSAQRKYLGSILTTSTSGQTEDSTTKRFIWNNYNRKQRTFLVQEGTASWTWNAASWHMTNASTSNRVEYFVGVADTEFYLEATLHTNAGASTVTSPGIGINLVTSVSALLYPELGAAGEEAYGIAKYNTAPAAGYSFAQQLEFARLGTPTMYGNTGTIQGQSGMMGYMVA